jgi:hypothetical protein
MTNHTDQGDEHRKDEHRKREWSHGDVIPVVFWGSAVLAVLSLIGAGLLHEFPNWCYREPTAYLLVGLWVAIPPLWFLYEYVHFPPAEGTDDERMRHLHDLCRNIWIALVAILTAMTGIDPFAGG